MAPFLLLRKVEEIEQNFAAAKFSGTQRFQNLRHGETFVSPTPFLFESSTFLLKTDTV